MSDALPLLDRISARDATVVVFGQGYVGLLLALHASDAGFEVVGVEPDAARAAALAKGSSYVDDVPDDLLQRMLDRGYRVVSSVEDIPPFDVAVIAVPTPLREGRPDLRAIEEAGDWAGRALQPGALVVLESTTYPGTTRELLVPILESASGLTCGTDFLTAYSPERIDPGSRTFTLASTPKVLAGMDDAALAAGRAFYGSFVETLVCLDRPEEAELTKLLENTFRHVNIALVNELAVFAHDLGVDLDAAIDAAATKPFGFMAFRPGPGVGGHCLPVDPSYLSWKVERDLGTPFRFVELANEVNAHMAPHVVRRVQDQLNADGIAIKGSTIVVLGLAYKPDTGDVRESPSTPIIAELGRLGADVIAVDPHVDPSLAQVSVPLSDLTAEILEDADLVLVLTNHSTFDLDLVARHARRVFDTRACMPTGAQAAVERL
ncbi:MAG: nucleotide sugar dehydrogenase [Acidimicrobiia bacterium]